MNKQSNVFVFAFKLLRILLQKLGGINNSVRDHTLFHAVKANLGEQKLLQNAVKEFLNFVSRDIGWLSLELIFYGGQGLFRPNQDDKK